MPSWKAGGAPVGVCLAPPDEILHVLPLALELVLEIGSVVVVVMFHNLFAAVRTHVCDPSGNRLRLLYPLHLLGAHTEYRQISLHHFVPPLHPDIEGPLGIRLGGEGQRRSAVSAFESAQYGS